MVCGRAPEKQGANLNIIHMKYAVEIAKTGSISKAGDNLRIAQPNLSRSIKSLEAELGITIFERTSHGMELTPDGETFIQYANAILTQVQTVENLYKSSSVTLNRFSISVPRGSYIADAFARFSAKVADEQFEIYYHETNSQNAINNILQNNYHLGIIRYAKQYESQFMRLLSEKDLASELITEFQYVLLMNIDNPLNQLHEIHLSDLSSYIEILHADPFVPSVPIVSVRKAENITESQRKIYVFERGSQFSVLEMNPNSFMWVSPVPANMKERYHLTERKCEDNDRIYKDVLIYRKGYRLSALDKLFITELIQSKRACIK